MIATALLPLMFITPASDEPSPIDSYTVQTVIEAGGVETLCNAYGELMDIYQSNGMFDPVWIDVADAFVVVSIEGDSMRLLPEARDTLTTYLHSSCG